MGSLFHTVQRHQLGGMLLVLLLLMAPRVPALSADPIKLRTLSVVAFDIVFMAPLLLAAWRKRRARSGGATPANTRSSARANAGDLGVRTIGFLGCAAFAACYVATPTGPAEPHNVWYSALVPALDVVRTWSGSIAGFEHMLEANGRPADAPLAGYNLAMLWLIPGLCILAGFVRRWSGMNAMWAGRLCESYRSRFSGVEVLRKIIDRAIVVLFVWNMPMAGAADPNASSSLNALAESIVWLFVGARGGMLLLLCCVGLEWIAAEVFTFLSRNEAAPRSRPLSAGLGRP